jgi:hypothetical protein
MKLSDKENRILDGHEGSVRQKAMEFIVRYGRIVGAEVLCKVTWADLFCGSHHYLDVVPSDDFDIVFSKMSLCSSETVNLENMDSQCICFSGVDADCSEVPDGTLMTPDKKTRNARFLLEIRRCRCRVERKLYSLSDRIHSTNGRAFCQL